jgi:FAD synthetase
MVFGTFDQLHKGHEHFFKQAKALSLHSYLIVSVARDINVKRIKGRLPKQNEQQRKTVVGKHQEVDKVVLGAIGNPVPHILKQKPDIIALGYDQHSYIDGLRAVLNKEGLKVKIVRLKSYKPHIYKSSKIKAKKS